MKKPSLDKISAKFLVIGGAGVFCLIFGYATWWKFHNFLYDNLDLAIFTNSLANGFSLTNLIHPPNYWADHFSPFLLLLEPLFKLWSSPQLLLWFQVLTLAAVVWPLYALARNKLSVRLSVIICWLWLANPLIHNLTLFEFSLVPQAIFFLLWTLYFYQKNKFLPFLATAILALSTREDIVFIIIIYSVLAFWEKKSWLWRLTPIILTGLWFLLAQLVIRSQSLFGGYKFSLFYNWVESANGGQIAQHFFNAGTLLLFLALFLPFIFLPLRRPRYLLFAVLPLASLLLGSQNAGNLLLKTHYVGLLIWCLFPALILALELSANHTSWLAKNRKFMVLIMGISTLYSGYIFGPLVPALRFQPDQTRTSLYQQALAAIPKNAGVAATYSWLSTLSDHKNLQLLPYAYAGYGQFALTPYALASSTDYLTIDWKELLYAQGHYPSRYPDKVTSAQQIVNLKTILSHYHPIFVKDEIMILAPGSAAENLSQTSLLKEAPMSAKLSSWWYDNDRLNLTFDLPALKTHLFLKVANNDRSFLLPLGYGLYSEELGAQTITLPLWLDNKSETSISLYGWKTSALTLNDLEFLGISWPDKELLLQKTIQPDTPTNAH